MSELAIPIPCRALVDLEADGGIEVPEGTRGAVLEDYDEDGYLVEWHLPDSRLVGGFDHAVGTAMKDEVELEE